MTDLLTEVLDAHGGLDRWHRFSRVRASIVSGGQLWGIKGLDQDASPRQMTVALHQEWASVQPFGAYLRDSDGRPMLDHLMVSIDLSGIHFE